MGLLFDYIPLLASALALIIVISYIHTQLSIHNFKRANGCKPAPSYPQSRFLLGLDFFFELKRLSATHQLLSNMIERFQVHGNTYILNIAGRTIIQTAEPDNIKAILATRFADFDSGALKLNGAHDLMGPGIFLSDGKYWAHSRAMIKPGFGRHTAFGDLRRYDKHQTRFVDAIKRTGGGGSGGGCYGKTVTVDLRELFFKYQLDSSTEFLMGESTDTLLAEAEAEAGAGNRFGDAFDYAQMAIMYRIRMGKFLLFHRDRKYDEACRTCREFARRNVERVLANHDDDDKTTKHSILDNLVDETRDPVELTNQLLHLLLAGRDTTASLLSSTMFVLAKHPAVWAKLRAEVLAAGGFRELDFERLKNIKYISYVLKEVLRLHPVVPANSRTANKPTFLPTGGGPLGKDPVYVSKGQIVQYSYLAVHMREDLYGPDVRSFKPERWENLRLGWWDFLPFGGGPRVCIGQQYAFTDASYMLARLASEFREVVDRDGTEWRERVSIVTSLDNGVKVEMVPA